MGVAWRDPSTLLSACDRVRGIGTGLPMAGIIQCLRDSGFQCIGPNESDGPLVFSTEDDRRPAYRPFEMPRPTNDQIEVIDPQPESGCLFRFFLDGSMRTAAGGHVVDTRGRYLPIFVVQIGVAATRLDGTKIAVEEYRSRNILFMPDTFSEEDKNTARYGVRQAANASRLRLDLELDVYPINRDTVPMDSARERSLTNMHLMEIELIKHFSESGKVTRDSLLMIDGSLQFYENLDRQRESFRNVVGIAKSFNVNQRVGTGAKARAVGTIVTRLKHRHRTPAHKIEHRNLSIGAWYLRLHSPMPISGLGVTDGVVKIEIFPDNPIGTEPSLDTNRCNVISENVLSLRHPTTPWHDPRWASHLYPIHLTERYIRTRFKDNRTMMAIL